MSQTSDRADSASGNRLNSTSPTDSTSSWEKRLWVVQDAGDRYLFRTHTYALTPSGEVFAIRQPAVLGTESVFSIVIPTSLKNGPEVGDSFIPTWEVMKNKSHAATYFRLPEIGLWSNWELVNRTGFRITWKAKDKKTYSMYLQSGDGAQPQLDCLKPPNFGCIDNYGTGIALYAYLTRADFPKSPEFVPNLGHANLAEAYKDPVRQTMELRHNHKPLFKAEEPVLRFDVVKRQMETLGLERVHPGTAEFGKRDLAWVEQYKDSYDAREWRAIKTTMLRGANNCDSCHFMSGTYKDIPQRNADGMWADCKELGKTGVCTNCAAWGRVCSWSPLDKLGFVPGGQPYTAPAELKEALFWQEANVMATTPFQFDGGAFRSLEDGVDPWRAEED